MRPLNNNDIFVTDFSNISMTTNLLQLKTPKGEIALDIHKLLNQDLNSSDAYFNATQIAKLFGKRYQNITKGSNWIEYTEIIQDKLIKSVDLMNTDKNINSLEAEIRASKKLIKNRKNDIFIDDNGYPKAIVVISGKKTIKNINYHGGTWLHYKLAIKFVGLLSPKWEVELHEFMETLIKHTVNLKDDRLKTKVEFRNLTDVIKEKYIPAQKSLNAKKWAYMKLADLVNYIALGRKAREYKKAIGVTDRLIILHGAISIRDYMQDNELKLIYEVEQTLALIIDNGLTTYNELYTVLKPLYKHKTIMIDSIHDTYKLPYDGYTDDEFKKL